MEVLGDIWSTAVEAFLVVRLLAEEVFAWALLFVSPVTECFVYAFEELGLWTHLAIVGVVIGDAVLRRVLRMSFGALWRGIERPRQRRETPGHIRTPAPAARRGARDVLPVQPHGLGRNIEVRVPSPDGKPVLCRFRELPGRVEVFIRRIPEFLQKTRSVCISPSGRRGEWRLNHHSQFDTAEEAAAGLRVSFVKLYQQIHGGK